MGLGLVLTGAGLVGCGPSQADRAAESNREYRELAEKQCEQALALQSQRGLSTEEVAKIVYDSDDFDSFAMFDACPRAMQQLSAARPGSSSNFDLTPADEVAPATPKPGSNEECYGTIAFLEDEQQRGAITQQNLEEQIEQMYNPGGPCSAYPDGLPER